MLSKLKNLSLAASCAGLMASFSLRGAAAAETDGGSTVQANFERFAAAADDARAAVAGMVACKAGLPHPHAGLVPPEIGALLDKMTWCYDRVLRADASEGFFGSAYVARLDFVQAANCLETRLHILRRSPLPATVDAAQFAQHCYDLDAALGRMRAQILQDP